MQPLPVTLGSIITARKTPLVAGNRILMRLDTPVAALSKRTELIPVVLRSVGRVPSVPAQREIRRRHDLDKVHVVVIRVVGLLVGSVQGVQMMAGPRRVLAAELLVDIIRQLRAKAQVVDGVGEGVAALDGSVPVVLEVVHVHVAVAEAAAGGDVEVADDLVDAQSAVDAAPFVSLLLELLGVVFPFALLDAGAGSEGPGGLRVGFLDFLAGVAASCLLRVVWGRGAVAGTAVGGV